MSSKLESEYLLPEGLLAVVGLELKPNNLVVEVASWEPPMNRGKLHFPNSKLRSLDAVYLENDLHSEPDYLDFPWDYQLFDSNPKDNGRWEFTLVSHVLEIVFEAEWPTFTKK